MLNVTGHFMQVLPRHHSAGGSGTIRVKISKSIVVFTILALNATEVGTDCSMKFYPCLHFPFSILLVRQLFLPLLLCFRFLFLGTGLAQLFLLLLGFAFLCGFWSRCQNEEIARLVDADR
jgi:hypothetical protein